MVLIKKYRAITPGTRFKVILQNKKLKKNKIIKTLVKKLNKKGGRNNLGRITVRHRGGGHKRRYRKVLFKRPLMDFNGIVCGFEYDPNRTAFLAKIFSYTTLEYYYILAPKDIIVTDSIKLSRKKIYHYEVTRNGDSTLLKNIRPGSYIHNIELKPGKGGQLVRTAGNFAILVEHVGNFVKIRLRSGEIRLIPSKC